MKEWECVQVGHHKNVGKTIEEWKRMAGVSMLIKLLDPIWEKSTITCCLKEASEHVYTENSNRGNAQRLMSMGNPLSKDLRKP